jgi:hypothetical protein
MNAALRHEADPEHLGWRPPTRLAPRGRGDGIFRAVRRTMNLQLVSDGPVLPLGLLHTFPIAALPQMGVM